MRIVRRLLLSERAKFERICEKWLREKPLPDGVREVYGVPYGKGEAQRLNVYVPERRTRPLPVVLDLHGGGLAMGRREFNRWFCARLCLKGFVVLAADYRLVPEHSAFDALVDTFTAMEAAPGIARRFGGDPSRLFVAGDSAGAYLAAFASAMQGSPAMAAAARVTPCAQRADALALVSGMFCTTLPDRVGLTMPPYLYGRGWRRSEFARYLDPARWTMLDRFPPSLLVTSGSDMLRAHTLRFARALKKAGAPFELMDFPADKRLPHAFSVFAMDEPETEEVIGRIALFFRKHGAGGADE